MYNITQIQCLNICVVPNKKKKRKSRNSVISRRLHPQRKGRPVSHLEFPLLERVSALKQRSRSWSSPGAGAFAYITFRKCWNWGFSSSIMAWALSRQPLLCSASNLCREAGIVGIWDSEDRLMRTDTKPIGSLQDPPLCWSGVPETWRVHARRRRMRIWRTRTPHSGRPPPWSCGHFPGELEKQRKQPFNWL